jgi:hypothetical protein
MFVKEGRKYVLDVLNQLRAVSTPLVVRLSTNLPAGPIEDWVYGDFTEPTFTGYSGVAMSSNPAATIDGAGKGESVSPTVTFTCSATPGSPQTIYTIWIEQTDTTSAHAVLFAFELDTPVVFNSAGDQLQRVIDLLSDNLA